MRCSRALLFQSVALSLLLGFGLGCATAPPQLLAEDRTAEVSASGPAGHADHSHHHGGAKALSHTDSEPPTSFAEVPEVGTEFTCPVSGGAFEVEKHTRVSFYDGRYYALCCGGCQQDFDADPAHFIDKMGRATN